jgi:hypothetical protein
LGTPWTEQAVVPEYEIPGEGQSTIDFGFTNEGQRWRVEMVRLGETQAVKLATDSTVDADGIPWTGRLLRTDAEDPKQSLEGETLKAVQRICPHGSYGRFWSCRSCINAVE